MRSARVLFCFVLCGTFAMCRAQTPVDAERTHESAEWANLAAHLPDPASGTAERLEQAGDVLRARRYPTDALRFYGAALLRSDRQLPLLKKMGIVCMDMQQHAMARAYFQRAVEVYKRDAGAWNNLGAAEYVLHDDHAAVRDYKHAIKLERDRAVYHSNLALVYFDRHAAEDGRRELARALAIDPDLLRHDAQNGDTARVLASTNYPEICFEMARIYAAQGNVDAMLDWLTKASDRGLDVRAAMNRDETLRPLLADVRVKSLIQNAESLRASARRPHVPVPSLGPGGGAQ